MGSGWEANTRTALAPQISVLRTALWAEPGHLEGDVCGLLKPGVHVCYVLCVCMLRIQYESLPTSPVFRDAFITH